MSETRETYADGLMDVVVQGGVVRLDFYSLSPTEKGADGKPISVFRERVVMPLPGFAQAFSTLERVMKEMIDRGVLQRVDETAAKKADA